MPNFYARYVPSGPASPSPKFSPSPPTSGKRRADREISRTAKKSKTEHRDYSDNGSPVLADRSVTKPRIQPESEPQTRPIRKRSKVNQHDTQHLDEEAEEEARNIPEAYKVVKRLNKSTNVDGNGTKPPTRSDNEVNGGDVTLATGGANDETGSAVIKHGLEPIPQPSIQRALPVDIAYSTLPAWMEAPVMVDESVTSPFTSYDIDHRIIDNLRDKKTSLPVQSAVLPLLLKVDVWARPDLCISAATGSGKTLAYVLPIVQALSKRTAVSLRAVVVVPTRALVKQVLQSFELCSKGLNLKIATTEGGKTLEEEQQTLVAKTSVYDPEEYRHQQNLSVDWATFPLEKEIRNALKQDSKASPNVVTDYVSKVDVLITTPGRLIEHLQSTEGFNMDYVEWFVADEADRLLVESYHEWLDTVLPALQTSRVFSAADRVLANHKLGLSQRRVTKVLLSATMTSDISQLLHMDLVQAKLVVLQTPESIPSSDHEKKNPSDRASRQFNLPSLLEEIAVPLRDAENKPLYLLQILRQCVLSGNREQTRVSSSKPQNQRHEEEDSDDTSSSGSSTELTSTTTSESASSNDESSSDSTSDDDSTVGSVNDDDHKASELRAKASHLSALHKANTRVKHSRALIFTRSTEAASRLARLLTLLDSDLATRVASFSSTNTTSKSKTKVKANRTNAKTLAAFATGDIHVLISTDLGGRGLDIAGLDYVINYDVPNSAETYIHRVGRTARAGNTGTAFTLVEHKQGKWFWDTIGGKGTGQSKSVIARDRPVKTKKIEIDDAVKERYEQALTRLGEDVRNG